MAVMHCVLDLGNGVNAVKHLCAVCRGGVRRK